MKIDKFVKPKDCEMKYQKYLFLLQNVDESCFKLTCQVCGKHDYDNVYLIEYQKFGERDRLPLYFVISQFYGRVYVIDDASYLYMSDVSENFSVLSDHKKLVEVVIERINELRSSEYRIKKDYCRIRSGQCIKKMPVGVALKISWAVVSFELAREGKNGLLVYGNLKESFYESLGEGVINDDLKSLEIKNESYYFWNDQVYLKDFDEKFVKVVKRESRVDARIYYVSYEMKKPEYGINSVNSFYLVVANLLGRVEQIKGSSDWYLVVDESNKLIVDAFENKDDNLFETNSSKKIAGVNKWRFSSDVVLPLGELIKFHSLTIVVGAVIEKGGKFWRES